MMQSSGALSRSRPSDRAGSRLAASRFDRGDEEWRPALCAYYKARVMFMRAELIRQGLPLDMTDRSEIAALRAALEVAPL